MPAQGASLPADGCGPGGAQSYDGRLYREAMARNTSPQDYNRDFDRRGGQQQPQEWDDADWDPDQEAAACHRARRLLSGSNSGFNRFGDGFGALRRWLAADRWLKRLAIVVGVIVLTAAVSGSSITLVIAVVVSLLGFIGSASLAKLLPRDRL